MEKLLNYVESESRLNMAFHIANADALSKESNTFLNLLLGASGGLLAFLVSLAGKVPNAPEWQLAGVSVATVYLFHIAGLLLWKCLWVRDIWPPANEPRNYPLHGFGLDEIRIAELVNRQACIAYNVERNESVGKWLNRCRGLAAAVPIVTVLSAWLAVAV